MRFKKATFVSLFVLVFAVSSAHAFPVVNFETNTQADWDTLLAGGPITPSVSPVTAAEWAMIPAAQQNNMAPASSLSPTSTRSIPAGHTIPVASAAGRSISKAPVS